MLTKWTW